MRLNILSLLASASVLSLPLSTFSRAIPHSSISARNDDAFPHWVTGVDVDDSAHLHEVDTESYADLLKSRATSTKPKPKPDAPDAPDVSTSDEGIDRGAGIQFSEDGVPLAPSAAVDGSKPIILPSNAGPASVQRTQAPKPTATADSIPSTPSAPSAAPEGPQGIPEYCKGPADGLARRSECFPGQSGDNGPGAGGIDSEPVLNQRTEVDDWFVEIAKPDVKPHTARNKLDERVDSDEPDIALKELKKEYKITVSNDKADTFGGQERLAVKEMLRRIGVEDINTKAVNDAVDSITPEQTVIETSMSKDGRLIISDYSDLRDVEGKPVGDMRWNELVFSMYKSNMEKLGTGTTKLQHVGRANISNLATRSTIATAQDRNPGLARNGVFTFRADATDANERAAFDALSRTDNVNGVYWFLSDFHGALGNKKLTAIHSQVEPGGKATLILDIGRG